MRKFKKIKIGKKVELEVEVCDTIFKRARGLMFRKNPKPLLFLFKKPTRQPIHSFFCKPFKAIWLYDGKIIDEKTVQPFKFSVMPKGDFTEIIEIPLKTITREYNHVGVERFKYILLFNLR